MSEKRATSRICEHCDNWCPVGDNDEKATCPYKGWTRWFSTCDKFEPIPKEQP